MTEEIWRKPGVLLTVRMSQSWLYDAVSRKAFPPPIKLGSRAVGWRKSDVLKWLQERPEAREGSR